MKMFRLGKLVPLFMSKANQTAGPTTLSNGVPLCGSVDLQNNLWVAAVAQGPAGAESLTSAGDNTDAQAVAATGDLKTIARNYVFNGATWDRLRSVSAAILATFSPSGGLLVNGPGQWTTFHTPAAATQSTCTRAGVALTRHVCKSIAFSVGAVAVQANLTLVLRDGATGVGAILWSQHMGPFLIGTGNNVTISGLDIPGTAGNAMTLEFTAAPAATNFESVAMTGIDAT